MRYARLRGTDRRDSRIGNVLYKVFNSPSQPDNPVTASTRNKDATGSQTLPWTQEQTHIDPDSNTVARLPTHLELLAAHMLSVHKRKNHVIFVFRQSREQRGSTQGTTKRLPGLRILQQSPSESRNRQISHLLQLHLYSAASRVWKVEWLSSETLLKSVTLLKAYARWTRA